MDKEQRTCLVHDNDEFGNLAEIKSMIKVVRGIQVMLDRDLAKLYEVETKVLNQAVKRNLQRFPNDFRFQLTMDECSKSQFVTLNAGRGHNIKKLPFAFTEQGVAMLSGVLRSDVAIEVNIRIMRAFVAMRHFMAGNASIFNRLETIEFNQVELQRHQKHMELRLDEVFRHLDEGSVRPKHGIFFDGQIYDAYNFVAGLVKSAKKRVVLIDNYIDDSVLTLLDKRAPNVSAVIYTKRIDRQLRLDIDRHNAQYPVIEVNVFSSSHDRFLCIDDDVFHIGASIKDLGQKWFGFSKMEILTSTELVERINRVTVDAKS